MGLTSWKHSPEGRILKSDVSIAKNYLTSKELEFLQDIVNMYLDIAENRAKRQIPMKMKDWVEELNTMLKTNRYEVLDNKGTISSEQAKEFAEKEFGRTLSSTEIGFINSWTYNPEIIKLAIQETVLNQVYNVKYTDKILYEWDKANLRDTNSIKKYLKKRRENQSIDNEECHYRRLE